MRKKLLTPWFPAEVKPVRAGWYQRKWEVPRLCNEPDYFDGLHWFHGYGGDTPSTYVSSMDLRWRGLAKKP